MSTHTYELQDLGFIAIVENSEGGEFWEYVDCDIVSRSSEQSISKEYSVCDVRDSNLREEAGYTEIRVRMQVYLDDLSTTITIDHRDSHAIDTAVHALLAA